MADNIEKFCPIWPSKDIDAAEGFYARLGFATVYKDHGHGYLILKREAAELHFFAHAEHRAEASISAGYMRPRDIDALSAEWDGLGLPSTGIPRFVPAEDKPWGMRELAVVDLDGNLIRAGLEIPGWVNG